MSTGDVVRPLDAHGRADAPLLERQRVAEVIELEIVEQHRRGSLAGELDGEE